MSVSLVKLGRWRDHHDHFQHARSCPRAGSEYQSVVRRMAFLTKDTSSHVVFAQHVVGAGLDYSCLPGRPMPTESDRPALQLSSKKRPRRTNAARLFGYDIFISFALGPLPRGTQSYASDLARRLRERDFAVFFSEDEAPPR